MGGKNSKNSKPEEWSSFKDRIRSNIENEIAKRAMMQREVQMAVNIAKARDNLQIFGSIWLALVAGAGAAKMSGRPLPSVVGIPIVVGAIALGNMADMAYGNKLARVTKEAEYILEYERPRFAPMKQAPFNKFYTDTERAAFKDPATAVGDLWPSSMVARSFKPPSEE